MVNAVFSAQLCWHAEVQEKTGVMGSSSGVRAWGAVLVGVAAPAAEPCRGCRAGHCSGNVMQKLSA